jgi:[acyl-carrier-protein] S-malonyltransferase
MGKDLAEAFPEARKVFEEVDDALGEKLSKLIWEGPEETLTLTANAQPALMAVSLAAIRALEARGFSLKDKVAYVAGHSLGEYSALAAAGFVSVADAARLLRIRGNAMQAAVPAGEGAMAAIIGLEQAEVEAACVEAAKGSVCQIANDNGGGQLVISGAKGAVERAAALCTEKGAKRALMLQVSAPFHSALMAPAAEAMRAALADVQKHAPVVPVISNVAVASSSDPDEIARRLVEQVTGRVRWRETVEWFGANGVATLYEVGAGKVLSGLARRINRDIAVSAINGPADVDAALAALS